MMKWFLEQTINAEDLLLNNNTDCTVSSQIPEEDDSDILEANSLPSVPDPEFCVRTTEDLTAQGKSKELKKELSDIAINNFLTVEKETHQNSDNK